MSWFRPKTHGYGATPATWQGWLAVAGFIIIEVILAWAILGLDDEAGAGRVVSFVAVSTVLAAGFARLSRAWTDGEWRWRWGPAARQD